MFIVHRRDNETRKEVARFIKKIGFEPIILYEQSSSDMTIIEKIENTQVLVLELYYILLMIRVTKKIVLRR